MDLAGHNSDLVLFEKLADSDPDPCIGLLDFANKWYVGSKSGCSCTFRFLHHASVDLGFSEPVDWYQEEQDELDATRAFYRTLKGLLSAGHRVDLVSRWEGAQPGDITTLDVSLEDIPENAFRFFEDYKFRFRALI